MWDVWERRQIVTGLYLEMLNDGVRTEGERRRITLKWAVKKWEGRKWIDLSTAG